MKIHSRFLELHVLLLIAIACIGCAIQQNNTQATSHQPKTLLDYHKLREAEEMRWDRKALEAAIRSESPTLLLRINHTLDQLTTPYADSWPRNLVDLEPLALDSTITTLCELYRSGNPTAREYIRSQIVAPQGESLLIFSQRAAVVAERTNSPDEIRRSLIALAIENLAAGDVRDDMVALALILHCARRIKIDPKELGREIARISGPAMSSALGDFLERDEKDQAIEAMGFEEVKTEKGVGYRWPAAQYR